VAGGNARLCNGYNGCASRDYWHKHPEKVASVDRAPTTGSPRRASGCGGPNFRGWSAVCNVAKHTKGSFPWKGILIGAGVATALLCAVATDGAGAFVCLELVEAAEDTGGLASRVDELNGVLDAIAQNSRTTAVMSTEEGTDILASGGRDLSPAQRALANEGDILARSPGAHAEITALEAAEKAGLTPSELAVSRPICAACQAAIEFAGGMINDDLLGAYWP